MKITRNLNLSETTRRHEGMEDMSLVKTCLLAKRFPNQEMESSRRMSNNQKNTVEKNTPVSFNMAS